MLPVYTAVQFRRRTTLQGIFGSKSRETPTRIGVYMLRRNGSVRRIAFCMLFSRNGSVRRIAFCMLFSRKYASNNRLTILSWGQLRCCEQPVSDEHPYAPPHPTNSPTLIAIMDLQQLAAQLCANCERGGGSTFFTSTAGQQTPIPPSYTQEGQQAPHPPTQMIPSYSHENATIKLVIMHDEAEDCCDSMNLSGSQLPPTSIHMPLYPPGVSLSLRHV
jgi:hypothetical protein